MFDFSLNNLPADDSHEKSSLNFAHNQEIHVSSITKFAVAHKWLNAIIKPLTYKPLILSL